MITIDEKGMAEAQKLLAHMPKAVPVAAARAINRAVTAAKTEAWNQVKKTYTIKRTQVSKAWDGITKATASNLKGQLRSSGAVLPLFYFSVKPKNPPKRRPKNPVYVQVRKDGGGSIRNAFVARMKKGHTGVFQRVKENMRLPIKQDYGPSVPQMLGNKTVTAFIRERAAAVLNERFTHEVNNILKGVTK